MTAPTASELVLTMTLSDQSHWTLKLPEDESCATVARQTRCVLRFSAGGNPGGTWTGSLHKSTRAGERVRIRLAFSNAQTK